MLILNSPPSNKKYKKYATGTIVTNGSGTATVTGLKFRPKTIRFTGSINNQDDIGFMSDHNMRSNYGTYQFGTVKQTSDNTSGYLGSAGNGRSASNMITDDGFIVSFVSNATYTWEAYGI